MTTARDFAKGIPRPVDCVHVATAIATAHNTAKHSTHYWKQVTNKQNPDETTSKQLLKN